MGAQPDDKLEPNGVPVVGELLNPLILNGSQVVRGTFAVTSPYYPGFLALSARAERRDISYAIGCARSAPHQPLSRRIANLERAAAAFTYTLQHLEYTVRMTGMPIGIVEGFYRQIPELLRSVAQAARSRFGRTGGPSQHDIEHLDAGRVKLLLPEQGFCCAVSPGNDPRASALIAANLAYLGIPFILRASPRDAVPPLLVEALIQGGFEPTFASLVYLDPADPASQANHFRLVDASSIVWTFGAADRIDPTLRFETLGRRAVVALEDLAEEPDLEALRRLLETSSPAELIKQFHVEKDRLDHFQGKTVLRHSAGSCAGLAWGDLDEATASLLYQSFACPAVCSAIKSVRLVGESRWREQAADLFQSLVVGDPLDPATQVGYVSPANLDQLEKLTAANDCFISKVGGRRISEQQAEPLLIFAESEVPAFFTQEIPAYLLAVRTCTGLDEAVDGLNQSVQQPRLAVTLFNPPASQRLPALLGLKTHAVMINQPTSQFTPLLHEGNDYLLTLSKGRLLMF